MIPEGNVIEAAFVVRSEYACEREARALIHISGTAAADHLLGKTGLYGPLVNCAAGTTPSGGHELVGGHANGAAIVLRVDPRELISEILPDPRLSLFNTWRLLTVARRYGFAQRVRVWGLFRRALKWLAIARQIVSRVDRAFR
jgi:hypothetical protein